MTKFSDNEAELIAKYFAPLAASMDGAFGLADDAALISSDSGSDIVISTDPVREGVHFFSDDAPAEIAWKALAVNVSDLVAKGASPFAYTMALSFPRLPDPPWLTEFVGGLRAAQSAFGCGLIGGDTDCAPGPMSIAITAFGRVPKGGFVRRNSANIGDVVYVSGTLGDAALGLALRQDSAAFGNALSADKREALLQRYLRPQPRPALVDVIRAHASAALDVSDGVVRDAARLAGNLSLSIAFASLPLSPAARAVLAARPDAAATCLAGGDYEVLMAVPPSHEAEFTAECLAAGVAVTAISVLTPPGKGICCRMPSGEIVDWHQTGYDHFSQPIA